LDKVVFWKDLTEIIVTVWFHYLAVKF
jgi:hypothetical protein